MTGLSYMPPEPPLNKTPKREAIPADVVSSTNALRNDIAQRFEIQTLVYELLKVVEMLKTPDVSADNDHASSKHHWDPNLLKKLLQIGNLDSNSKVLQLSNGPGNKPEDFGIKPGNLTTATGNPAVAQSTLNLPYENNGFDEVWNTQGIFSDLAISNDAKKMLERCSLVIPKSEGFWSPLHLESGLRKLFAIVQLAELLRVTKPGGNIRFAGAKQYLKGSEISSLFETDHYASCTDEKGDIDLIAMGAPNAAILHQLIELPDLRGLEAENTTDYLGGYSFKKRPEFSDTVMLEFLAKRYRDLFPPKFLEYLKAAQNLDVN